MAIRPFKNRRLRVKRVGKQRKWPRFQLSMVIISGYYTREREREREREHKLATPAGRLIGPV